MQKNYEADQRRSLQADSTTASAMLEGIKTDAAIRNSTNAAGIRLAYVTDPWGTEIEITEGLRPTS